jgi:hypothetical protein
MTWPASIDDSAARKEWGWQHKFDLQKLADDMLTRLAQKLKMPLPPGLMPLEQQQGSSIGSSNIEIVAASARVSVSVV